MYFCLNPLGTYCLGITDEYSAPQPEVQHRLRVLPNLEIAAMGEPLSASEVLQLEGSVTKEYYERAFVVNSLSVRKRE